MAATLAYRQGVWQVFVADHPGTYIYRYGWPSTYCEVWDFRTILGPPEIEYHLLAIVVDMVTSIVVLASTVLLTEQILRRKGRLLQLELRTVFG